MSSRVCLVVSRRCDLRCRFCHVDFTGQDMTWATAERALRGFQSALPLDAAPVIKLFGGEPLLNFELVRRVIVEAPAIFDGRAVRFELPTNGSSLDQEKRDFLRRHPGVEVIVSRRPQSAVGLPGAWYTMVLDRDCDPAATLEAARAVIRMGFRKFNVLPAYYVRWAPGELRRLRASFQVLARLFNGFWELGRPMRVRNAEVSGSTPLFNDAWTADVDGSIYASNMVECKGMEPYARSLRLGHVDAPTPWTLRSVSPPRLRGMVRRWAGPEAWRSTELVDGMLSEFMGGLRQSAPLAAAP